MTGPSIAFVTKRTAPAWRTSFARRLIAASRLFLGLVPLLRPLLQDDLAGEVRREQLNLLALTARLFAVVGSSSIVLLAVDFRMQLALPGDLLCLLIPGLYALHLLEAWRWKRERWKAGGADRAFVHRSVLLLAALGTSWGLLTNLLMRSAQPHQTGLLDAVIIALISTPVAASPLSAALAFWLPSAVSGLLIIAFGLGGFDPYLMLCYIGYANFTLAAIVQLNRFMLERSVGRIVLEKQNQTIGMFLRDYAENAADWLWEADQDLRLRHVSPRFAEVAGRTADGIEGLSILDLLQDGAHAAASAEIAGLFARRVAFRNVTVAVQIEGETRWWSVTGRPIVGDGARFEGYRGIGSDVTEVRRSEQRVQYLALHDSLTGLANRPCFMDSLQDACDRHGRTGESVGGGNDTEPVLALLILDLDRFKLINDNFGHAVGDTLLEAIAGRLRGCVRNDAIVARLGGDEFGLLLPGTDAASTLAVCQRIIDVLNVDYALAGSRHTIGVSIGVSFLEPGNAVPAHWLRRADLALYAAKAAGRGVYRVFHADMMTADDGRLSLRADLKSAIADGKLRLAYQPIYSTDRDEIVSVEALCRWDHDTLGPVSPAHFIRLAEETGLIVQLGAWALTEACRAAADWPGSVRVAVNVSPLQLRDGSFLAVVVRALAQTGLAAERLELELTEYAHLDATGPTLQTLQGLRGLGTRIVLDDFGTGYSSLSYVAAFECDGIKIESSFVQDLETSPSKLAVVRALGQLARDLAIPVTAEGVETRAQLDAVRKLAVTHAQGYLLQRPAAEEVVRALIQRQDCARWQRSPSEAATAEIG